MSQYRKPSFPLLRAVSNRRHFLQLSGLGSLAGLSWEPAALHPAPAQAGPAPIPEPHFPDRLHLFVWRNWELANLDTMARVLRTRPENVLEIGASMGLPAKPRLREDQLRRIYITVIRQNWHLLPEDQLVELLGWDRARYEFTLKEDDFLLTKLGLRKPHCEPLYYQPPSEQARRRAAETRRLLEDTFGDSFLQAGEEPFHFVKELSRARAEDRRIPGARAGEGEVDISGWSLSRGSEEAQMTPWLEELQSYLRESFSVSASLAPGVTPSPPSRSLHFVIDPGLFRVQGSFEIRVEGERVQVAASDAAGLRAALYELEEQMEGRGGPFLPRGTLRRISRLHPRYLYSYFALYGDPLLEPDIDPFPEGYLRRLGRLGVNGVWLQGVLRNLAPSRIFPEFGEGWETRLENLRNLVRRARHYGLEVFLYINEPRTMPESFFERYPDLKGSYQPHEPEFFAMCTSVPRVRQWIRESLTHLFRQVPELGGIFTITMSENLTNCFSKGRAHLCPRCSQRQGWEVVSELLQTFLAGVRQASSRAQVIAWDWGWGEDWVAHGADAEKVIEHLPEGIQLQSVSEWDQPVRRGGFSTEVGEYSISVVGPGPRARRHWTVARQRGLRTLAKVQLNCTWEISAVPFIPVPHLVRQHLDGLLREGIDGIMLSWTVGGYPSPNLAVAREYYFWPTPDGEEVLRRIAVRRYGQEAAESVLKAWESFSAAFQEFPYGVRIYIIPTQHGPANLLRLQPTGYLPGMILFPQDDVERWVGPYPPEIVQQQFARMSALWEQGLEEFRAALARVPASSAEEARKDLGVAETCALHFRSVANQIRFYLLRRRLLEGETGVRAAMEEIARDEMDLARRLYQIARLDSRIGFEASNHYYYRPLDLAEKVLNCQYVLDQLQRGGEG